MIGRNKEKELGFGKLNDDHNEVSSDGGGYDDGVKMKNGGCNNKGTDDGVEGLLERVGVSSGTPASTEMVHKTCEGEKDDLKSLPLNVRGVVNYGSITEKEDHHHTQGDGRLKHDHGNGGYNRDQHQEQLCTTTSTSSLSSSPPMAEKYYPPHNPNSSCRYSSLDYENKCQSLPLPGSPHASPYNLGSGLGGGSGHGSVQSPYVKRFPIGGASNSGSGNYPRLKDDSGYSSSSKSTGGGTTTAADDSRRLTFAFVVMVIVGTGNRIFMKLQTYPMYDYPFFLNVLTTFVYVPACFVYIIPMILFGESITPEQRAFPKYKFAVMGFLDGTSSILGIFAVNYIVNAGSIVLLQQAAIPVSMCISKLFLGARYTRSQYAGAVIVMLGIMVTLQPMLWGDGGGGNSNDSRETGNQVLWYFIQVLSCVPMALSSVYKEKALGQSDIDVIYLNGWVSVYQSLSAVLFAIPSAWAMGMELGSLPGNMYHGFLCFLGQNTEVGTNMLDTMMMTLMNDRNITAFSTDSSDDIESSPTAASCSMAPFFVSSYLAFNMMLNVVLIIILKYGSANVLFLASTVMLPIGNVVFSLKFVPGHQNLMPTDVMGLFCILLGLFLYRFARTVMNKLRRALAGGVTSEEVAVEGTADRAARAATKESVRYIGLNQAEYLEPMVDTWVRQAQFRYFLKSPERVRADLLLRLGIPPSPVIRLASRGGSPYLGRKRRISEPRKMAILSRQQSR